MAAADDVDAAGVGGLQAGREDGAEGRLRALLRHAERGRLRPEQPGFSATTTNTNSTDFGQTFLLGNPYAGQLGISDPFPVRADGTRFDEPTGAALGVDTIAGSGYTIQNQNHEHARQQRWRIGVQRELARNLSVEVAYDGSYSDRVEIEHPSRTTCRSSTGFRAA